MKAALRMLLLLTVTFPAVSFGAEFARTSGTQIVGPGGSAIQLRGINLGGWLVPEGYILHVPGTGSPSSIRALVQDMLGAADTERFYQLYTSNYIQEADIAQVAQWGLNSVRVPFHYRLVYDPDTRTFLEPGFELLRTLVGWCKKYGIYVILDMHCAPGGQNAGNISDSDGVARLWTDASNQDLTVTIWVEIARRFAGEPGVLGYDLLNEPVLPTGYSNANLMNLYRRLGTAIRAVDSQHILIVEGNQWATDFSLLTPAFDSNLVYSFHKYWNGVTQDTIQSYLDLRASTNAPLWLGEFGENSNAWGYDSIRLMERENIGWCWWTLKKVDTITGPLSVPISAGYQKVLDYWNGRAARPSASESRDALFGLAADLSGNVAVRPDVVAVLTDRNAGATPRPFRSLHIPGTIHAVDYDIGNEGVSYHDNVSMQSEYNGAIWNSGWAYRNDGVDIEASTDSQGFAYDVGWMQDGEWLTYSVNVAESTTYQIQVRAASAQGGGRLRIYLDDVPLGADLSIPNSGGWQAWTTVTAASPVSLTAGPHVLKLLVVVGGFNLNLVRFTSSSLGAVSAASFATDRVVAPGSIASLFGANLSNVTRAAETIPLPSVLGGVTVTVTDSTGRAENAPLFYVSASQINFLVPAACARGEALLTVARDGAVVAAGVVQVEPVVPGLFSANGTGAGVAVGAAVFVAPNGTQTTTSLFQCGAGGCVAAPLALDAGEVVLVLYGTGIRGASSVTATIGGVPSDVLYAGAQPQLIGLDQVNVRVPQSLAGRGEVPIVLTAGGRQSNAVTVAIR